MLRSTAAIAVVLSFFVATAGCNGDGDDNAVRPGVEETRDDKLPTNFPAGFPLPPDSKVLVSGDLTGGVKLVLFEAEPPEQGLRTFFVDELPKQGWALANCTESPVSPEPVVLIVATKEKLQANVTAGYLNVDYPIEYKNPYSFAVQYWETEGAFATPSAVPEACLNPAGEGAKPSPPAETGTSPGATAGPN